jgi:hypothetical protein
MLKASYAIFWPFNSEQEKGIHVSGVDPPSTQLQRQKRQELKLLIDFDNQCLQRTSKKKQIEANHPERQIAMLPPTTPRSHEKRPNSPGN